MRIQHNIIAMNAYRNYNNNTSALSKNLEKLSSGYKINRAGDDAAGLAISEKMRAQITGLEGAQQNAKDGISLVQTAEGALTEVHDMLNRMYDLAEQSANGTYEDETDRAQLQKEVVQLRTEIDRIADSANFNGIQLLDGSLSSKGGTAAIDLNTDLATTEIEATAGKYVASNALANATGLKAGDTISYTFALEGGNNVTVDLTYEVDGTKGYLVDADGNKTQLATQGTATGTEIATQVAKKLEEALGGDFKVSLSSNSKFNFEAKEKGTAAPKIVGMSQTVTKSGVAATTDLGVTTTVAKDAKTGVAGSAITAYTGTNADAAIFTINGQKFALVANTTTDVSALGSDVTVLVGTANANLAAKLSQATGMKVSYASDMNGTAAGVTAGFIFDSGSVTTGGGGLTLQIGDTGDSFNQLTVSINDCHAKSLGINSIDIGTQKGAAAALKSIEDAINYVSDVRGTLGATQNRLDHTINNLSVMQENIQDAESTIRDTDIAEEMMSYTKNNILVQSAQAMLAQANQVPQGVLQLLQ